MKMYATWRQRAHRIIGQVIADNPTVTDEKALRKLISAAYPWGERDYHPYKAWCKAVSETFAQPAQPALPPKPPSPAAYADTPLFEVSHE